MNQVIIAVQEERPRPEADPPLREVARLLRDVGALLVGVAAVARGGRAVYDEVRGWRRHRHSRRNDAKEKSTPVDIVILYRPVGPEELDLIRESGFRAFPPRLADQPIFYPVMNEEYATQIARDWNVKASGAGYVTRFAVRADF